MDPTVQASIISGIFLLATFIAGRVARFGNKRKPPAPEKPADLEVPELWQMWVHIQDVETKLKTISEEFSHYKSAASRYFEKLAAKWPGPDDMPEPDEADKQILELTLSRIPKRKPKGTP